MSGSYNAGSPPTRVVLVDPTTLDDYSATSSGTGASSQNVQGPSASGGTAGNPIAIGSTGSGLTYVVRSAATNADAVSGFSSAAAAGTALSVAGYGFVYNGATWDRVKKANVSTRVASSAASGNAAVHKASAGELVQFWGLCGATAAYLQVYNKATAPTIGTDTPVLTYPLIANSAFEQVIPGGGYYFSTGISFAFTTDAAGTTGSAAAAITSFNMIGS